jgi:hypothetical protein
MMIIGFVMSQIFGVDLKTFGIDSEAFESYTPSDTIDDFFA